MDFLSRALVVILTTLGIRVFLLIIANEISQNKITDEECVIIYYPKAIKVLFLIAFIISSVASFFALSSNIYAGVFFVIFALLCLFLVLKVFSWKIYVYKSKDYFKIRTFLFITHIIKYRDCKIWRGRDEYKIKVENKTFLIDKYLINIGYFINRFNGHFEKENSGKLIKQKK